MTMTAEIYIPNPRSNGGDCSCNTWKVVNSHCRTEEVEPGIFLRKCDKTEQLLKDCLGRPVDVLQSHQEYTKDDVTNHMLRGSFPSDEVIGQVIRELSEEEAQDFPGLRSDIEAIGRSLKFPGLRDDVDKIDQNYLRGALGRFFQAAEELKDCVLSAFRDRHERNSSSSSPSKHRGVPIKSDPQQKESFLKRNKPKSGDVDLSGSAEDA